MLRRIGSLLGTIVTAVALIAATALLTLSLRETIRLQTLYAASTLADTTRIDRLRRWSIGVDRDALIFLVIITVLTVLVFRFWRRRLRIFSIALIIFAALNLTAARHLLPTWLIPPLAPALGQQYVHAVLTDNRVAALDLSEQSEVCLAATAAAFEDHRALLQRRLGATGDATQLEDVSVRSATWFYDQPVQGRYLFMLPVPSQLYAVSARFSEDRTVVFDLKTRHQPYFGPRYLCGQDMQDGSAARAE